MQMTCGLFVIAFLSSHVLSFLQESSPNFACVFGLLMCSLVFFCFLCLLLCYHMFSQVCSYLSQLVFSYLSQLVFSYLSQLVFSYLSQLVFSYLSQLVFSYLSQLVFSTYPSLSSPTYPNLSSPSLLMCLTYFSIPLLLYPPDNRATTSSC